VHKIHNLSFQIYQSEQVICAAQGRGRPDGGEGRTAAAAAAPKTRGKNGDGEPRRRGKFS
jgi:hypothetical protein